MQFYHRNTSLIPAQDARRAPRRFRRNDALSAIYAAARTAVETEAPHAVMPTATGWKIVSPEDALSGSRAGYYLVDHAPADAPGFCAVKSFVPAEEL